MKLMFNGKIGKNKNGTYIIENQMKMHTFGHDLEEFIDITFYPVKTIHEKIENGTDIIIKCKISDIPITNARNVNQIKTFEGKLNSDSFSCKCYECEKHRKVFEFLELINDTKIFEITDIFDRNKGKYIHLEVWC